MHNTPEHNKLFMNEYIYWKARNMTNLLENILFVKLLWRYRLLTIWLLTETWVNYISIQWNSKLLKRNRGKIGYVYKFWRDSHWARATCPPTFFVLLHFGTLLNLYLRFSAMCREFVHIILFFLCVWFSVNFIHTYYYSNINIVNRYNIYQLTRK